MSDQDHEHTVPDAELDSELDNARRQIEAGMVAFARSDIATAGAKFQQARQVLDRVSNGAAPSDIVQSLLAEVAVLVALAERAQQAQADIAAGQPDAALAALAEAIAMAEQHEYAAITTVLTTVRQSASPVSKRVKEEAQHVAEGKRLLDERRLDRAARRFRSARNALLPETRQQAEEGQRRVEEELHAFEEEVKQANQAGDPFDAVVAWQRAFDRWPYGHRVSASLADALALAGETALADSQQELAQAYFDRALQLDPEHMRAQAGQRVPARAKKINASIEQARDELGQIGALDFPAPGDFTRLHDWLAPLLEEARDLPDHHAALTLLLDQVDQQQNRWDAYAAASQDALHLATTGDWPAAVHQHVQVLGELGSPVLPGPARRQAEWESVQQITADAETESAGLLQSAQTAYNQGRTAEEFADALEQIERLNQLLARAEQAAHAAGGALSRKLQTLRDSAELLRRRAEAAQIALAAITTQHGLSGIREAIRALGDDPVLRRVADDLEARRAHRAPELLQEALDAEAQDAFDDALDLLRQVLELDPKNAQVPLHLEQIGHRKRFEEILRRYEIEAEVAGSSLTAVSAALRRALEAFLLPEFAIPNDTRATIRELTRLADEDDTEALASPAKWERALNLRDEFASRQGWADRRALQLAVQWLPIAREAALRGAIRSLAQLGDALGSYRTALSYRRVYNERDEALEFLYQAQVFLRQSLTEQANKLLSRAHDALDLGEHATALDNLERLELEYYGPIEREFPHLLDALDENQTISKARGEIAQLQVKATRLRELSDTVKLALDAAEQAFLQNEFAQAEQMLQALTGVEALPELERRINSLREQIGQSRIQQAQQQLGEQLARARMALSLATTHEHLDAPLNSLEQLGLQIDWTVLTTADRDAFNFMTDQLRENRAALAAVPEWEEDAAQALRQGDLARAARSLQRALQATRNGSKRARLQIEFEELDERMKRLGRQNEAIQRGRQALNGGDYAQALDAFAQAHGYGADVDQLTRAARAGALLRRIRTRWEERQGLDDAQAELDLAQRLAQKNPEAELIAQELEFYQDALTKRINSVESDLRSARNALSHDDLSVAEAHVRSVLGWDSTHVEANRLQSEIQTRTIARTIAAQFQALIERAEQELVAGHDSVAVKLLNDALQLRPNDVLATNLLSRANRESQANETLRQAREQIYSGKFQDARRLIQAAENEATPALLQEVRRLREDLESTYRTNTIYPIRNLMRDERFREALRRCDSGLKLVESETLRDDLIDLQLSIVKRWVDKLVDDAQSKLQVAGDAAIFTDIATELQARRDELAAFPESQRLSHTIRQADIGRLNYRLKAIETFLTTWIAAASSPATAGATPVIDYAQDGPRSPEEAQAWVQAAAREAEHLALDRLRQHATVLAAAINEQLKFWQTRKLRSERSDRLTQARQILDRAQNRWAVEESAKDLAQARELVQGIRQLDGFHQDREAIDLLDQIDAANSALEATQLGIERSAQALARADFEGAWRQIQRIDQPYILLRPRYEHLHRLLEHLVRAETFADQHDWRRALAAYRQAAQEDPTLEMIAARQADCQKRITDSILPEVRAALQGMPPNPARALALLDEAEAGEWIHPPASAEVARLRAWTLSQQRVVDALSMVSPETADPEQAMIILQDSRQLFSDPEMDERSGQIEIMAQALLAWRAGALDDAQRAINQLRAPIAALPQARAAQQGIERQLLAHLRQQAARALQDWDANVAGSAIRQGLSIAPGDAELLALSRRQQQIEQSADALRAAMQSGWQALEDAPTSSATTVETIEWAGYQTARQRFEAAARVDPLFVEANRWSSYAEAMALGLQATQQKDYEPAARSLEQAAQILRIERDETLSALLGEPEHQAIRRRQASYRAARLAIQARDLAALWRDFRLFEQQEDETQVLATIDAIRQQQQIFVNMYGGSMILPDDESRQSSLPEQATEGNHLSARSDDSPIMRTLIQDRSPSIVSQSRAGDEQESRA